jgi:hypothetical protein
MFSPMPASIANAGAQSVPAVTIRWRLGSIVVWSAALCALSACRKVEQPPPAAAAPTSQAPAAAVSKASTVPAAVRKAFGKWVRADGGYVLEIRGGDLSGVLDAAYFNPKSIHVSRAIWMQGGAGFQFVIELNDVGYPGATYVLSYDEKTDQLVGKYNQPAMQQSFDIEFVRQPNP